MICKTISMTAALMLVPGIALAQTVSDSQLSEFCENRASESSISVELVLPDGTTIAGSVTCSSGGDSFDLDDDEQTDEREFHDNNGRGNGVQDAPGNSGDTRGDDADGANTEGTEDTSGNGNGNGNGGGKKD
jgi:hypothetical protein